MAKNIKTSMLFLSLLIMLSVVYTSKATFQNTESEPYLAPQDTTALDSANNLDEVVGDTMKPRIVDTLSFRYRFVAGDSLFYSARSRDSITINYDSPLLRLREENILITCDSVSKSGRFYLTQKTIAYRAVESYKDEKNIEVNDTEWLNVPVHIVLDSLGRRIHAYNPDTLTARLAPGGAFKPILLITLIDQNENYKADSTTWMNSNLDTLVENGVPIPLLKSTSLFRLLGKNDTLGRHGIKINFARTGQGSYELVTDNVKMKTSCILNSGGYVLLDTTLWVPFYFTHSMEQQLTFHQPNDQTFPGLHHLTTIYTLDTILRRTPPIINKNKFKKQTGKNKK